MNLGIVEENLGHYDEAQARYEQGAGTRGIAPLHARAIRDPARTWATWRWCGATMRPRSSTIRAPWNLARAIGDLRSQANRLENLGLGHTHLLETEQARRCLAQAPAHRPPNGRPRTPLLARSGGNREPSHGDTRAARRRRGVSARPSRRSRAAREDLNAGAYTAECPRLLRLEARAKFRRAAVEEGTALLTKALSECAAQKNASEETPGARTGAGVSTFFARVDVGMLRADSQEGGAGQRAAPHCGAALRSARVRSPMQANVLAHARVAIRGGTVPHAAHTSSGAAS